MTKYFHIFEADAEITLKMTLTKKKGWERLTLLHAFFNFKSYYTQDLYAIFEASSNIKLTFYVCQI